MPHVEDAEVVTVFDINHVCAPQAYANQSLTVPHTQSGAPCISGDVTHLDNVRQGNRDLLWSAE